MTRASVKFRPEARPEDISALEARHGLRAVREILALRLRIYDAKNEVLARVRREALVEYVEEDSLLGVK